MPPSLSVPPASLAEALAELETVHRKLRDTQRALELSDAKIQEKSDIMTDLLILLGCRETCSKCNAATYWVRIRGCGNAVLYNLDGTQHWPRCPRTARPGVSLAIGGLNP
jgi:hypothetical protein